MVLQMVLRMQQQQQEGHPVGMLDHQAAVELARACACTSARSENGLWSSAVTCSSSLCAQMLLGIGFHSKYASAKDTNQAPDVHDMKLIACNAEQSEHYFIVFIVS